jgi:hypothetical protein
MSNRERWVVYPLLFLSIGLGLRNGIDLQEALQDGHAAEVELLRCKSLEVVAADGKPRITLGTSSQGEASLETAGADGKALVRISSNASGASLNLFDRMGQSVIRLGYENPLAMLLVMDPASGQMQQLFTVPLLPIQLGKPKADGGAVPSDADSPKGETEGESPSK